MSRRAGTSWARRTTGKAKMVAVLLAVVGAAAACGGRTQTSVSEQAQAQTEAVDARAAESGAEPDALSCAGLFNEFHRERMGLTARAERACREAADCEVVGYGASCFAGCGHQAAVAVTGVDESLALVAALEERYCTASASLQCVHRPLPCLGQSPPTATCEDGVCSLE